MTPFRPDYRRIAGISITLCVVGLAALQDVSVFVAEHYAWNLPVKTGFVTGLIGLFWLFFEKVGWKFAIWKKLNLLELPPNLNGRYEGTLSRNDENNPHSFVIEITQTYSKVSVSSFSKNASGHSICAAILVSENDAKYVLVYTWYCKTRNRTDPKLFDEFHGTSMTEIHGIGEDLVLHDDYYTRRVPPTRGTFTAKFQSREKLGRFS